VLFVVVVWVLAGGVSRRPNNVLLRWGRSVVVVAGALAGALAEVELRLNKGMVRAAAEF